MRLDRRGRRREFGIEQDVDAGQLAHGFEQNLGRLIVHLQTDGRGVQRLQLRQRLHGRKLFFLSLPFHLRRGEAPIFRFLFGGGFVLLTLDHALGALDLFFRHGQSRIDAVSLLEFRQSFVQFALVAQPPALIHVILPVVIAQPGGGELVGDIGRILAQRLLGKGQCSVPILADFGGAALRQQLVAFAGARLDRSYPTQGHQHREGRYFP